MKDPAFFQPESKGVEDPHAGEFFMVDLRWLTRQLAKAEEAIE